MLRSKSRLKIAASCFSIYAYEALKKELKKIEGLEFIFTAPTFIGAGKAGGGPGPEAPEACL